jgi:hypothetical protein
MTVSIVTGAAWAEPLAAATNAAAVNNVSNAFFIFLVLYAGGRAQACMQARLVAIGVCWMIFAVRDGTASRVRQRPMHREENCW